MDPKDRLVSSGSFRVDRSRALDKLMRFQLPDARMYPLPWVQAAVASGASWIRVVPQPAGLELSFDGRPWAAADLADPYRHLFDEDPDGSRTRHRELAIGLLTALRLPPAHVTAAFVDGGAQYVLRVRDLAHEHLEPAPAADAAAPAMALFVAARTSFARERELLERHARYCPVPISMARARLQVQAEPQGVLSARFERDGVSGAVRLPDWAPDRSRIELVTHGVVVAEEWMLLPGAQLEGWVRNDAFRKTLSQMGVVKDAFYLQAMGLVVEQSARLLKEAAGRAWAGATACGQALGEEGLRLAWMPWETANLSERLGALVAPARAGPEAAALREQSVLVAALRQAALHRRADILADKRGDGLPDLLAEAPLLFDALGRPLALRALMAQARWLGHVPTVDARSAEPPGPLTAAWVVREADRRFLEAFFPERVRRLSARDAAGFDPQRRPVLDDASLLVKVPFMAGPVSGEAGLSLSPHPRRSRLRWIGASGPLGQGAWELRGLRLEAVLHHPRLGEAPREGARSDEAKAALAALLAAAPGLYQLLAREYVPDEDTPRMAAVREHLMDFLRLTCDARSLQTPAVPWMARLPLMLDKQGRRVSLEDLRRRSEGGAKAAVRASVHPERLAPLVAGYPDHVALLFAGSDRVEVAAPKAAEARPEKELRPPRTARLETPPAPAEAVRLPKTAHVQPEAAPKASEAALPRDSARSRPAASGEEELVLDLGGELKRWLAVLRERGACSVPEESLRSLRLVARGKGPLLRYQPDSAWELDAANPLAAPLSELAPLDTLPYLASLAHSGLNRALAGLTDAQDAAFTEALARLALERHGGA